MRFSWDDEKSKSNIVKHKISFDEASTIFNDENILSIFDEEHSDIEERWISIGLSARLREIVVVHLFLTKEEPETIRIISARKATKQETIQYNSGIGR